MNALGGKKGLQIHDEDQMDSEKLTLSQINDLRRKNDELMRKI